MKNRSTKQKYSEQMVLPWLYRDENDDDLWASQQTMKMMMTC